ncbi:MAG: haloacid dehalogenase [Legionella sp.]|nr:MAG: haloacid dehalogenase [Legionella sp.]
MMNLIFDFDGTLVDSFDAAIKVLNILALDFNFRQPAAVQIKDLKTIEAKTLLKILDIPMYKIPFILRQAKRLMHKEMAHLKPFPGIPEVLHSLHASGFCLGIVTSNSEENVKSWLKQHEILSYFEFIHSAPQYFGKERILSKSIKKYQLDKKKVCYIGDETRDIEAAKRSGIASLAVTWGFNCEEIMHQHQPHYIARMPADIITLFSQKDR